MNGGYTILKKCAFYIPKCKECGWLGNGWRHEIHAVNQAAQHLRIVHEITP